MNYKYFNCSQLASRIVTVISAIILLALAASCAPHVTVNYDYNRLVDFSTYKTYKIHDQSNPSASNPDLDKIERLKPMAGRQRNRRPNTGENTNSNTSAVSQLNADRILYSIQSEMSKKGFMEDKMNPDLLVNVVTILKDKRSVSANHSTYAYGGVYRPYGHWAVPVSGQTTVQTSDYKEGTLIIDIVDARTKKIVWTGDGNGEITKKPKDPDEAIRTIVSKIMESFPPDPAQDCKGCKKKKKK